MTLPKIILASQSPRRQEYLKLLGVSFNVQVADIDETATVGEPAVEFVKRMATEKASAVLESTIHSLPILAADTVIELDNRIIGKPADQQGFIQQFMPMSDRSHWVHTAVAILYKGQEWQVLTSTEVTFAKFDREQANAYWETGEPSDKAGGYGIQGIGAKFVKSINGSYSSVVGLPLCETKDMLEQVAKYQVSCGE